MSIKTERLGNMLHKEISNILMTEVKDEDSAKGSLRVNLNKSTETLTVEDALTLKAVTNVTEATLSWESSDSQVASVSGGKVSALKEGSTIITVTATANGNTATDTCVINVERSQE